VLTNVSTPGGGTAGLVVGDALMGAGFPTGVSPVITAINPAADTITLSTAANASQGRLIEVQLANESTQWTTSGVSVSDPPSTTPTTPPPTPPPGPGFQSVISTIDASVSNSGLQNNLVQLVQHAQQSYGQKNINDACHQVAQLDQTLFQQSSGNNAQVTPANATTVLNAANNLGSQMGCASQPTSVEDALLSAVGTVNGLHLSNQAVSNQVEQGYAQTGQDLSQAQASNACHDLANDQQQTQNNANQMTASQLSTINGLTSNLETQLKC
jgi:hypothetical protein